MKKNKGGATHGLYGDLLFHYFQPEADFIVREGLCGDKLVDLLLYGFHGYRLVGIEVQLIPKHALENIRADIRNGCDRVIMGCPSTKTLRTIKAKAEAALSDEEASRVTYLHIRPDKSVVFL